MLPSPSLPLFTTPHDLGIDELFLMFRNRFWITLESSVRFRNRRLKFQCHITDGDSLTEKIPASAASVGGHFKRFIFSRQNCFRFLEVSQFARQQFFVRKSVFAKTFCTRNDLFCCARDAESARAPTVDHPWLLKCFVFASKVGVENNNSFKWIYSLSWLPNAGGEFSVMKRSQPAQLMTHDITHASARGRRERRLFGLMRRLKYRGA